MPDGRLHLEHRNSKMMHRCNSHLLTVVVSFIFNGAIFSIASGTFVLRADGFIVSQTPTKAACQYGSTHNEALLLCDESGSNGHDCVIRIPNDLYRQIQSVANTLWKETKDGSAGIAAAIDTPIPSLAMREEIESDESESLNTCAAMNKLRGEATLPENISYSERGEYFHQRALLHGCPDAQHSYALLLWSSFGGVSQNAQASAQWHAAAALQHNLDAVAVLGGCLRTGSGVKRNVALGLSLIEFSASCKNPSGVNKKAALLESNGDDEGAFQLYQDCYEDSAANALLHFNLGWCYVNGSGVRKDAVRGIDLWKEAAEMAPDEGSEEAAYHLYMEYRRDDPVEASKWLDLAADLGLEEAILEQQK